MDEGIKRKLVGSAVLVVVALIVLPLIAPKAKNAAYLSEQVPLETDIPNMDMALPKSLSLRQIRPPESQASETIDVNEFEVDGKKVASATIDVPVKKEDGQALLWQIRVGSFAEAKNAIKLRNALREKGYKAFERLSEDGQYTRVFIGPSTQKTWLSDQLLVLEKEFGVKGELRLFTQ
ncbi:SPOR domain-containing protein [Bermanella marisrubri]|uniref:SPOR domain-containing protein n=1 Tax=Bermanella marisrubri TaxID=207949 RepID=Q1N6P8_9GAMM|nr:SPOR domain-containing protein [Bermanella marisrubri]EAT13544.1 hypothetical protein RED65_09139 [Oceanobacter sp. RED65] [Bermanella marisrubri]QIZ84341.1 SPOR domain-containing protein [Bermanella marisrubri]